MVQVLRRPASIRRILGSRALRFDRPTGWVELGLDDVAETGELYGALCALGALIDPQGAIRVTPYWTAEDRLAGDVGLRARVHPLVLLVVIARILLDARRRDRLARSSGVVGSALHC